MHPSFLKTLSFLSGSIFLLSPWADVHAATSVPPEVMQAVVIVQCGNRQGSGTLINNQENYVLTNAHVATDVETGRVASSCTVGFTDNPTETPVYYYRAQIIKTVFQEEGNLDFAILKLTKPTTNRTLPPPLPMLKTNEFSVKGNPLQILGYPGGQERLAVSEGTIQDFQRGFIQTDAQLHPGDSGGAAIDNQHHLIGIPTRIVSITSGDTRNTETTYELVDIRAVMNWLDTLGPNEHDKYFTHADSDRYHRQAVYVTQASLGCIAYGRSELNNTVYCILPNDERLVFPDAKTFFSWQGDFQSVQTISLPDLASYRITRNVTHKPGTLVKSITSPHVYVVVDIAGTLRLIQSEEKAKILWGPNWAGLVRDVPDEFWINYTIGNPLD